MAIHGSLHRIRFPGMWLFSLSSFPKVYWLQFESFRRELTVMASADAGCFNIDVTRNGSSACEHECPDA